MNRKFFNSLIVKLFVSICLMVLPLIILQFVTSMYSTSVLRSQVVQSNENLLNLHMNQIDSDLSGVGNYVFQLSTDVDFAFYQDKSYVEQNEYTKAKLRLYNKISEQSNFYTTIDSIFIYSKEYDELIYSHFGLDYLERDAVSSEVKDKLSDGIDSFKNNQWTVWEGADQYYLSYIVKEDNYYVGAWVDMEKLITPFKFIDLGDSGEVILTAHGDHPVNGSSFLERTGIDLSHDYADHLAGDDEKYFVMNESSEVGGFDIHALVPEKIIMAKIPLLQRIAFGFIIAIAIFLFILLFIMISKILRPLTRLTKAMHKLQKGNLKTRLKPEYSSTEMHVLNNTFNTMIGEIEDLKISDYERKIELQQAELKHLQLQINPHFFLNTLNIIYNLSTVKEYALIQQMSKSLADYFRFMFKSDSYYVALSEEMKHTDNYLKIQQLRFPDGFSYHIDLSEDVEKERIPPLVIQSFVENAIKHAFTIGDPIHISVGAWQEQDHLKIEIFDTGEGFPDEVLERLRQQQTLDSSKETHIGIWNTIKRLEILYGKDRVNIHFSNKADGGALIEISLPINYHFDEKGDQ